MSCECPICFDEITSINCTTTECGHSFHSYCIFKNLSQNNGCPLCRKELVEVMEDSDDDSEEYEDDDEEEEEDEEEVIPNPPSVFQFTEALKRKGYSEGDFVRLILNEVFNYNGCCETGISDEKDQKMIDFIHEIYTGNKSVDYRDKRSYLDVIVGKEKCGETGSGPLPVNSKKVNFGSIHFVE
jgi:hypothetical protein